MAKSTKQTGFSLLELLITLAIIIILVIVATTTYLSQVKKNRRADAIDSLLAMSLAEERYRTTNVQYGSLAQVWGGASTSTGGYYLLSISNTSATGYTLTATGQGTQATDTEDNTACNVLQLTVSGGNITKTPSTCWPQ